MRHGIRETTFPDNLSKICDDNRGQFFIWAQFVQVGFPDLTFLYESNQNA
jgi:hypothetical protein